MRFKKGDWLIIATVMILGVAGLTMFTFPKSEEAGNRVVILQDQRIVYEENNLQNIEHKVIEVQGPLGVSKVEIDHGKVRMLSSPCPDKICERTGWISDSRVPIVCLPQRISVRIEGAQHGEIDEISE
jgi:hypothetical protein